jgi:hypothetical protein
MGSCLLYDAISWSFLSSLIVRTLLLASLVYHSITKRACSIKYILIVNVKFLLSFTSLSFNP